MTPDKFKSNDKYIKELEIPREIRIKYRIYFLFLVIEYTYLLEFLLAIWILKKNVFMC